MRSGTFGGPIAAETGEDEAPCPDREVPGLEPRDETERSPAVIATSGALLSQGIT